MSVQLLPGIIPEFQISGIPASGAQLFCYAAGTTTKQTTYTDSTGATAQTNPIILNARGEPQSNGSGASLGIWLTQGLAYKFVLAPSTDTDPPTNPIWTIDNVLTTNLTGQSYTATGTNAITLTPNVGTPAITAYQNYQTFSFVAPNTSTGLVTLQVGSLGYLPLYVNGAQASANIITAGQLVTCQYVSSIGASGAFVALITQTAPNVLTATDIGSANAYVINPSPAIAAYATGQVVAFLAANTNTGASTLNVNSLGAKNIKTTALQPLTAGQIDAGSIILAIYDGTEFQIINPALATFYVADTGTTNTYAINPNPYIASYVTGQTYIFKAGNSNTGASTLNVCSVGAVALTRTDGSALQPNDMTPGGIYLTVYDGSKWQLLNPTPSAYRVLAEGAFTVSGGTLSVTFGRGISSITRSSAGVYVVSLAAGVVPDGAYTISLTQNGANQVFFGYSGKSTSGFTINSLVSGGTATDVGGLDILISR